ncbi:MAG: DNA polymerase/3'-5' exonuclease PolX [Candidatus Thorarchaeota archaeon]|nr:DNA polymerase/3'-5' exonuclease PolX [Candidatus Thorarchaeota archaeon]
MGGFQLTKNREVAQALEEISLLLQIEGKDKFKSLSYARAARSITGLGEDIENIRDRGELTNVPGIGKAIADKIESFLDTGEIKLLVELRERVPVKVWELEAIPDVGPKTISLLYRELGVTDLVSLEEALDAGKLEGLKGMGKKTISKIADGIKIARAGASRTLLAEAMPIANRLVERLSRISDVNQAVVAGSLRRRRETIGDIDILVDASKASKIMDAFVGMEDIADVLVKGPTKSSVRTKDGLRIDLRVLPTESYGAGLQYFTGNIDHNVKLRAIAKTKGLLLNEYGLFRNDEQVAGQGEEGIYDALGLDYIPPELREDMGEIEAAQEGKLPKLIKLEDIRGDLHTHTDQSDGKNTIDEMLDAAVEKDYEYYCVSDHTQSLTIANGMDEAHVLKRIEEIDELNASGRWKMKILKGAEVDILAHGELDLDDSVLDQLDIITLSIHSRMKDTKQVMTERVCHALESKYAHILGHPTGRLLLKRPEFEIDMEKVFETARHNNVVMELNAHPQRLDLNVGNLRAAKRWGLRIAINTDAHRTGELDYMQYGIFQARRGWVEKYDVINTLPPKELMKSLRK